jgi:FtsP/CotA-like multicopper oxidase with cupredoxin domain
MKCILSVLMVFFLATPAYAKVVEYSFDIDYLTVTKAKNEPVKAMAIGGSIPAPIIEATVGDTLRATFHNKMNVETTVHWHGVLLPPEQDGVAHLNTKPIGAGESFTFEFPIKHSGTYWYHSHTGLQEQRGIYGPLVFHPKEETLKADYDYTVVLSDWSNENPMDIIKNIKKDGHYYDLKKGTGQNWFGAIANGIEGIKNRLYGAWIRMGAMDISDIGYDAFLINGKETNFLKAAPHKTIKLRVINAASSSYFNLEFAGGPVALISADGVDITPQKVKRLRIAIAETYDLIFKIHENKQYEFRATSEDGTGYGSLFIGAKNSEKISAPDIAKPNPYLVDHSMHSDHDMANMSDGVDHAAMGHTMPMDHSMHHGMDHGGSVINYMTDYEALRSPVKTTLPANAQWREIPLTLTGNMERYIWTFDNIPLSAADSIKIKKGENVRMVFQNETMMNHPLHLHGHFFRVVNKHGDYSPLKHTVNVPAMGKVIIEFAANEKRDWIFHCHNLYHMKSGMSRVISYSDSTQYNEQVRELISMDDHYYFAGELGVSTRMVNGMLKLSNINHIFSIDYDYGYRKRGYEIQAKYEKPFTRFFSGYIGGKFERHDKEEKPHNEPTIGIKYTLPLLIESDIQINGEGDVTGELSSHLEIAPRTNFNWHFEHDFETKKNKYNLELVYKLNEKLELTAGHDSRYNTGVGLKLKF